MRLTRLRAIPGMRLRWCGDCRHADQRYLPDAYYIDKYELTIELYLKFVKATNRPNQVVAEAFQHAKASNPGSWLSSKLPAVRY